MWPPCRHPGHAGQRPHRRPRAGEPHDAGRPRVARAAAAIQGGGCHGRGDGSVVARPGPGTCRRHQVRRRAVHQPDARPSRLSPHDGGVRAGQGEALRLAGAAHGGRQRRRRVRPEPDRFRARARRADAELRTRRGRHRGDGNPRDRQRHGADGEHALGQGRIHLAHGRHVQCAEPAGRTRRAAGERCPDRRRDGGAGQTYAAGRTHAEAGWHRPAAGHRRLRPHARRAGEGADGVAARGRRPARIDLRLRLRRRPRRGQAAGDGSHRGTLRGPHRGDQRQPAQRGSVGDRQRDRARRPRRRQPPLDHRGRPRRGDPQRDRAPPGQATSCSSRARVTRRYQERDGVRTPFSDAGVAAAALSAWTAR